MGMTGRITRVGNVEVVDLRHQRNGQVRIIVGGDHVANVLARGPDPMGTARIIADALASQQSPSAPSREPDAWVIEHTGSSGRKVRRTDVVTGSSFWTNRAEAEAEVGVLRQDGYDAVLVPVFKDAAPEQPSGSPAEQPTYNYCPYCTIHGCVRPLEEHRQRKPAAPTQDAALREAVIVEGECLFGCHKAEDKADASS
jgi:hypothetical protein